jgi:WD40 repeat protein
MRIWGLGLGSERSSWKAHTGEVRAVAFVDGRRAVSGSDDGDVKLWDLESKCEIQATSYTSAVEGLTVAGGGSHLVIGYGDGTVKVLDLGTWSERLTLAAHSGGVRGIAVSPDSRRFATASWDQTVKVWTFTQDRPIATFSADSPLMACAFSVDGLSILAGDHFGRVHFLHLEGPV